MLVYLHETCLIDSVLALLLSSQTSLSYGGVYSTLRIYLEKVIWSWQLGYKEGWTPLSATKFGWSVKIRSMQDDEFGRRCVGSDINWCNPHDFVSDSSWAPSWDVISSHHHDLDLEHWNHLIV